MSEIPTTEPKRIECPARNYYGCAAGWEVDGRFFMDVENYYGWSHGIEISKEFFDAFVKEFGRST